MSFYQRREIPKARVTVAVDSSLSLHTNNAIAQYAISFSCQGFANVSFRSYQYIKHKSKPCDKRLTLTLSFRKDKFQKGDCVSSAVSIQATLFGLPEYVPVNGTKE